MKNSNYVNVYVAKMPFIVENNDISPIERMVEIESCESIKTKNEKFYAWKLLEFAIKDCLNVDIKNVNFKKNNSKWVCDDFYFSLSHSNNIVAVVVAKNEVGIDVEKVELERFYKLLASKILTEKELVDFDNNVETINKLWTVKEALFKKGNDAFFNPCKIETCNEKFLTKVLIVDGEKFYISVATNDINVVKFNLFENAYFDEKV